MKFSATDIKEILDGVYSGKYTSRKLPKQYFNVFAAKFDELVTQGFGDTDKKILNSLIESTNIFSAAKTYQMVRELEVAAMTFVTKEAYIEAADQIFARFTEAWGVAEEVTALQQAYQAQKWYEIVSDADLFPNLRYETIGDACQICAPLNGIVARWDSWFWKTHYPTLHYHCFCIAVQEGKGVSVTGDRDIKYITDQVDDKIKPVFKDNVGISHEIFNKDHPYFDVPKKDKRFAKKGFGLT